jgi:hypothetical protein|tara:strand:+ start:23815 stop:24057 length:243 start_codon:yes stop_codon:yes gene_type:complete
VNNDEEFGFIKAKLESIDRRLQVLDEENKEQSNKMDELSNELAMYRHFVIWIRGSLLVGAFILTMKWGDLMSWFNGDGAE